MKTPVNLKYTRTDEWVKLEGKIAVIGISDFAQDQLSDIVYVELLKDIDDIIQKDDILTTIESVKAAGDVISPVSGRILEVNVGLSDKPELLNDDPYGSGWICKIEISSPSDYDALMNSDEYETYYAGRH